MMTLCQIREKLLRLIYPPRCVFCARLLAQEDAQQGMCKACAAHLPRTAPGSMRVLDRSLSPCFSVFLYRDDVEQSFHRFKFQGRSYYRRVYGVMLRELACSVLSSPIDYVTWAPLSKHRLYRRGYDQSRLLAEEVALLYKTKPVRLLEKKRNTKPQSSLSASQRRSNVHNVYRLSPGADIAGKHILLVDDVVTTGSTLDECAVLLLQGGAAGVTCLTFARSAYEQQS